jgi:glycosyltransferase involved in cell wall biosynthesis
MKVLWFSQVPPPKVCERFGLQTHYGCWWIWALLQELVGHTDLELAVAWAHRDWKARENFSLDGIKYYVFPEPGRLVRGGGFWRRLDDELANLVTFARDDRTVAEAVAVVGDFKPDLVHVFGTESCYGLAASLIQPPLVVWIQGILDVYQHHFLGSLRSMERLGQPRLLWRYCRMRADAAREREIYRRSFYFIGRTYWDAAHQARLQPQGHYFQVQECMRPEFYAAPAWKLDEAQRQTVYTTTSPSPLKGTDVLVQAIGLLRSRFPGIQLRVAGPLVASDAVPRRLDKLIKKEGVEQRVTFLGNLNGSEIVRELRRAHVFVLPSFIENSPNSLAEAQLVGVPAVAAFVGGVPDMVTAEETGMLYQAGDAAALAQQIARIMEDDLLAARISCNGRLVSHTRHSPARIVGALLSAYKDICNASPLPMTVETGLQVKN